MKTPNRKFKKSSYLSASWLLLILITAPLAWAKSTPQSEVHVTLLGQPCLLQGPLSEVTLRAIHSIGPAQIYPNLSVSSPEISIQETKKAIDRLQKDSLLPSSLDPYREKLGKRLEAQLSFFESFRKFQENHNGNSLLNIVKKYIQRDFERFSSSVKKLEKLKKASTSWRDLAEQTFDQFNECIEQDPESEFHRSIKKMSVQYLCTFEEAEEE